MLLPEPATAVAVAPARLSPVRVLAVASGKGGVGKTSIAVNMGAALARAGHRTLLLDADLGLANVDVMLGLSPRLTLADVIAGRCTINDTVVRADEGLMVIPAASGRHQMTGLETRQHAGWSTPSPSSTCPWTRW